MALSTEPGDVTATTRGREAAAAVGDSILTAVRMLSRRSLAATARARAAESTTTGFFTTGAGVGGVRTGVGAVATGAPALATSPDAGPFPVVSRTTNAAPTRTTIAA